MDDSADLGRLGRRWLGRCAASGQIRHGHLSLAHSGGLADHVVARPPDAAKSVGSMTCDATTFSQRGLRRRDGPPRGAADAGQERSARQPPGLAATLALWLTRAPQPPGASNGQPVALSDLDSLRALGEAAFSACEKASVVGRPALDRGLAGSPGSGGDHQERYRTSDGSADGFLMPATVHADTSDKRMRSESCSTTVPAT